MKRRKFLGYVAGAAFFAVPVTVKAGIPLALPQNRWKEYKFAMRFNGEWIAGPKVEEVITEGNPITSITWQTGLLSIKSKGCVSAVMLLDTDNRIVGFSVLEQPIYAVFGDAIRCLFMYKFDPHIVDGWENQVTRIANRRSKEFDKRVAEARKAAYA